MRISRLGTCVVLEYAMCGPDHHTGEEALGRKTWFLATVETAEIVVSDIKVCPPVSEAVNLFRPGVLFQSKVSLVWISVGLVAGPSRVERAH